jgi:hypothetical protein
MRAFFPASAPDCHYGAMHRRRLLVTAAIGVLVVGAFLLWGPIGLGNGPLSAAMYATVGGPDSSGGPVGFMIGMHNSGQGPAVIDGIELVGATSYPAPRLLSLVVLTSGRCGGPWPARQTKRGFVLAGCGGKDSGSLIGHPIGPTLPHSFGFPGAAEVTAPYPGTCWVLTEIIVHYHVGIRYYTATDPYELAVCTHEPALNAAMMAAANSR